MLFLVGNNCLRPRVAQPILQVDRNSNSLLSRVAGDLAVLLNVKPRIGDLYV